MRNCANINCPKTFEIANKYCSKSCSAKCTNNRRGKKASDLTKQRLSISHRGYVTPLETRLKQSLSHKGKVFSAEHCANISRNRKSSIRSNSYSSLSEKEFGLQIFDRFQILLKNGFWIFDKDTQKRYCFDYKVPNKKILIEIDGRYWHSLPGRKEGDRKKEFVARKFGYTVHRFEADNVGEIQNLISSNFNSLKEILL